MHEAFTLPPHVDSGLRDALIRVATAQSAVVRRDQLDGYGLPQYVVDRMLVAYRWRAHGSVVIAMHNGPLTPAQQLWASVLNAGLLSALAARSAATEQGLVGWQPQCIEIIVPKGVLVPPKLGLDVKVHESRRFSAADLHSGRLLPQVRMERALVDAAAWSRSPRTACGVLAAGVQQRCSTPSRIRAELDLAGAVRHRKILAAALTDIEGGAQAMSEIDFLRFCRRNGIPRPTLQVVRLDRYGRRRYLDATFERPGRRPLRVEIDGALHLVVSTYWNDMFRGNELVIGNELVMRFASYVIHADDPVAVDQLRRALDLSVPDESRSA